MALHIGMLIRPEVHRRTQEGKTSLKVNNQISYQRQSYLQGAPTGMQAVFIPTSNNVDHLVPAIVEEHKLFINPHVIALMFTQNPDKSTTWDIHTPLNKNTHNVNHSMCDILKVPITKIDEATIDFGCICLACKPPIEFFFGGLPKEVKEFKDILQQIIFTARFEDVTPAKCKIICTWYEWTMKIQSYIEFDGQPPRVQLHRSLLLEE